MVTNLTLISRFIDFRVSSLERDSLALVELFLAAGGDQWFDATNWLTGPISSWAGVTVVGERVIAVDLSGNNLTGNVPRSFADIEGLDSVDLSGNLIDSIPDLTRLINLTYINLKSNNIEFGSLEANAAIPGIQYDVQEMITRR